MQRRSVFALLFGASVAAGAGPVRAQSLDWEPIAGKDGRYSLEMPTGYRYLTTPQPDATTLQQYIFEWPGKGGLGFAIYDQSQVEDPEPFSDRLVGHPARGRAQGAGAVAWSGCPATSGHPAWAGTGPVLHPQRRSGSARSRGTDLLRQFAPLRDDRARDGGRTERSDTRSLHEFPAYRPLDRSRNAGPQAPPASTSR